ncbi:MAG: FAD:protein FMN transferase [Deltaproteobacteria bacterium]|nr:FAD:protein FMN transferase [Deltaproteobacteria bacterium]
MSTVYQITIISSEEERARQAIEEAFEEIARLESLLSEWRQDSEISQINRAAGEFPVRVGSDTMAVIEAGLRVSRASEGAFDLSWAALRSLYLFQPGSQKVPSEEEIQARLPFVNYKNIVVNRSQSEVFLKQKGMAIGTGGIAKGYALDRAGAILEAKGFRHFLMFGGGQIQMRGGRGDRPWRIGIRHPRREKTIAFVEANDAAIATSGDYERYFIDERGRRWHHIIDPRTGKPVEHTVQVTVITERGIDADAYSTACFVLGAKECLERLPRWEGHPEALIIDSELRVHLSPGAYRKIIFQAPLTEGDVIEP